MTDPENEKLVSDILRTTTALRRRLRSEIQKDDLTLSQISALARLERQGLATTADLARLDGVKPQSMGAILNSLEAGGYVVRAPDPSDKRQQLYELTPEAHAALEQHYLLKRSWLIRAVDELSGDDRAALDQAMGVLMRIASN